MVNLMSIDYWLGYVIAGVAVGVTIHFLQLLMNLNSRMGIAENRLDSDKDTLNKIENRLNSIDNDLRELKERIARVEQNIEDLPQQLTAIIKKELVEFENRQIRGENQ